MPPKIAAGNWKMHGDGASLSELDALIAAHTAPVARIVICPPATLIHRMAERASGSAIAIGGQTCHAASQGAHTGDIAAAMLTDAGATHVILGHSERRADHAETDAEVRAQAEAALAAGLTVIVCVGETGAERDADVTLAVVETQLSGSIPDGVTAATLVIAYEPVWAIGTGRVPTTEQIAEVHGAIRAHLTTRFGEAGREMAILYGGSVKPGNAAEIFAVRDVNGALVGGASLKAADFAGIIAALDAA
ncbi:triose-phosphate isomerase [Roseicyclus mahoneyensis]|uniref:Triosephosphate isomerase n=1 Tax=Roseicyclus mahoneyensis TaxID=164332 RepID=A0A316GNY9_9RHOB|nr:triose-phosphate isomerase [Roseicyclus mahoneyensis]PWK62755.1 triosephosphate isomerase [Roseicyclus mahoneyensis]